MTDRPTTRRGRWMPMLACALGMLLIAGAGTGLYVSGLLIDEHALTIDTGWSDPLWIGFLSGLALLAAGGIALVVRWARSARP